jgi:hypothetical protein
MQPVNRLPNDVLSQYFPVMHQSRNHPFHKIIEISELH